MSDYVLTRELTTKSFTKEDDKGNIILAQFTLVDGVPTGVDLYLKLKAEQKRRKLGWIDLDKGIFVVKRKIGTHRHFASNSYGFNYEILKEQHLFKFQIIHLIEDTGTEYYFLKQLIEKHGTFMNYKQQGFELQRFISLDLLKPFIKQKTSENEND